MDTLSQDFIGRSIATQLLKVQDSRRLLVGNASLYTANGNCFCQSTSMTSSWQAKPRTFPKLGICSKRESSLTPQFQSKTVCTSVVGNENLPPLTSSSRNAHTTTNDFSTTIQPRSPVTPIRGVLVGRGNPPPHPQRAPHQNKAPTRPAPLPPYGGE